MSSTTFCKRLLAFFNLTSANSFCFVRRSNSFFISVFSVIRLSFFSTRLVFSFLRSSFSFFSFLIFFSKDSLSFFWASSSFLFLDESQRLNFRRVPAIIFEDGYLIHRKLDTKIEQNLKSKNISLQSEICNVSASSDILYYIITLAKTKFLAAWMLCFHCSPEYHNCFRLGWSVQTSLMLSGAILRILNNSLPFAH